MSITALQEHIRKKKTPLALGLGPEANRLPAPVVKRFTDLYGESVMARSEALRYHGTQLMAQAAQRLPAVVLRADRYLLCGAMGLDVLSNLVHMARSQGLYAIVDARCADPDAVTVSPYYGAAAAGEDKALFALVRTAEPGAAEVQNLMAGDRRLFLAAGEQMARRGAGIMAQTDYSLDVRELRRRLKDAFLLLDGCSGEAASYAFDDFGRGAMVIDDALQYAEDVPAAMDDAVREMKHWVTVV